MNPIASHVSGPSDPAVTALQGASLAFNKKKPAPPPPKKDNGARSAATTAGRPRSPVKQLGPQSTGGSVADSEYYGGGMGAPKMQQLLPSPGLLYHGHGSAKPDPKSASFIAATLAASRSGSPTSKAKTPRRKLSVGGASSSSGEVVDSGSIAPTGSLISMFEQTRAGDAAKRASPRRSPVRTPVGSGESIAEAPEPDVQSSPSRAPATKPKPKPKVKPKPRPLTPPPQPAPPLKPVVLSPKPQRPATTAQLKPVLRPVTPPQIIYRAPTKVFSPPVPSPDPPKRDPQPARQRPPTPPQPRGSNKPAVSQPKTPAKQKPPAVEPRKSMPSLTGPPVLSRNDQRPTTADTVSSDDTFVSASSAQSPERRPSPPPPSAQTSHRKPTLSMPPSPSPSQRQRATAQRPNPKSSSTTSLPLDSLTNAIMASSLASARLTPHNTGGSLATPPMPRRQKSPRMMQTLRQPPKEDEEEADRQHKKGHLHKLHSGKKHSHHEGSRKRWREEITPRERKRYEAVWASNRGLLLDLPNSPQPSAVAGGGDVSEYVINIVVRQIWRRSRLPADELAEVWDLVDRQGRGILGRQEFVVGMWLIDQRLRGRKIPAKVSESVWGSAVGMKVVAPKVK